MTVSDLDGDEYPEIFITDYNGLRIGQRAHLLEGNTGKRIWNFLTGGTTYNIPACADINGDGFKEILFHSHRYNPSRETMICLSQDGKELWHFDDSPSEEQNKYMPACLGYVPDFGYISTIVEDFNMDGKLEIVFGTRAHLYLLTSEGNLIWKIPLIKGHGVYIIHKKDGTTECDAHGIGGSSGYAAAAGDINGDKRSEIVLSLGSEYVVNYYEDSGKKIFSDVIKNNKVLAIEAEKGEIIWLFEGEYPEAEEITRGFGNMSEPILVDLNGDRCLDVIASSSDGNIYFLDGRTGNKVKSIKAFSRDLTFFSSQKKGFLLYSDRSGLHALEIADEVID